MSKEHLLRYVCRRRGSCVTPQFINSPLGGAGLTWQEEGTRVQYHAGGPVILYLLCAVKTKQQLTTWKSKRRCSKTTQGTRSFICIMLSIISVNKSLTMNRRQSRILLRCLWVSVCCSLTVVNFGVTSWCVQGHSLWWARTFFFWFFSFCSLSSSASYIISWIRYFSRRIRSRRSLGRSGIRYAIRVLTAKTMCCETKHVSTDFRTKGPRQNKSQ